MRTPFVLWCAVILLASADAQSLKKKQSKKDKAAAKAEKHSIHDLKEEASAAMDAHKAQASSELAKVEMEASHMQTDADHKMEKAEQDESDIIRAKRDDKKDKRHASKDYKQDVKYWKGQEKDAVKDVGNTVKAAFKLTKHMNAQERAQYKHYAVQQGESEVSKRHHDVQQQATEEMKVAMWKEAGRQMADETKYQDYKEKMGEEVHKLTKDAKRENKDAKNEVKSEQKALSHRLHEEDKYIKQNEKAVRRSPSTSG